MVIENKLAISKLYAEKTEKLKQDIKSVQNCAFNGAIHYAQCAIMLMMSRLKTCNDVIKMGTNGNIDLFERAEYYSLVKMFDNK